MRDEMIRMQVNNIKYYERGRYSAHLSSLDSLGNRRARISRVTEKDVEK